MRDDICVSGEVTRRIVVRILPSVFLDDDFISRALFESAELKEQAIETEWVKVFP